MIKLIFRIIWYIIVAFVILLTIYLLFANNGQGIAQLKELFSHGFFTGIKNFFVDIWNGFKHVCGL